MKRPFKKRGDFDDIERQLLDARPEPRPEFVEEVADRTQPERRQWAPLRLRFGAAAAVTGLFVSLVIALGGVSAPVNAVKGIAGFSNASGKGDDGADAAHKQYKHHKPPKPPKPPKP